MAGLYAVMAEKQQNCDIFFHVALHAPGPNALVADFSNEKPDMAESVRYLYTSVLPAVNSRTVKMTIHLHQLPMEKMKEKKKKKKTQAVRM